MKIHEKYVGKKSKNKTKLKFLLIKNNYFSFNLIVYCSKEKT